MYSLPIFFTDLLLYLSNIFALLFDLEYVSYSIICISQKYFFAFKNKNN